MLKELLETSTKTTNGANAYTTTSSGLLDLFGIGGAARNLKSDDLFCLVDNAIQEDPLKTMRIIFYLGDIRQGMGERRFFQHAIHYVANKYPELMRKNIHLISEFNRWDSVLVLMGTPLEKDMIKLIKDQLDKDLGNTKSNHSNISLLAKWLPLPRSRSLHKRSLGYKLAYKLGYEDEPSFNGRYTKTVTRIRKQLNLIETNLADKEYDTIELNKVPTKALQKYSKVLNTHIPEKVEAYYSNLSSGEYVRKTTTLYPYEIVNMINSFDRYNYNGRVTESANNQKANALWKNLPDLLHDNSENILPIIDTSGSMFTAINKNNSNMIIDVAIGLGIYLAERNNGYFKDFWCNFSTEPNFYTLKGDTLSERVKNLDYSNWSSSTNIEAVYDLLLAKLKNNVDPKEVPSKILIVSDMQFNQVRRYNSTVLEDIDYKFAQYGIKRPTIVFWQVNASNNNVPITKDSHNTMLVSGFSQNLIPYILGNEEWTPMTPVNNICDSERYSQITI